MLKTPPLQTATATIDTLCGRLQSATLLEDRRAAILGLRSFAKQYPASVASGSLRELIATLKRDGVGDRSGSSRNGTGRRSEEGRGDVDTIRLVLETLLMLFNPDSGSPEAGDEIAFFMADEFSMRQDNIALLLHLLDPTSPVADYYSRLYSVQILSAICAARPEKLQECVLSAPLGVSRIVGMLDDGRDAVRNAGLLLLVDLTSGANEDLRKIVAFEDVFAKVFALVRMEGGLAEAGITAQDCLSLLANLVKGSASNQTMFRESGCVTQLVQLLQQAFPPADDMPEVPFVTQSREKSAFGLLQLLRLFLVHGESGMAQNQAAFFRAGTAQILIDVGFASDALPPPIRTVALKCAAELIARNAPLQEAFAALTVIDPASTEPAAPTQPQRQVNGSRSNKGSARPSAEKSRTYIIEALLDLSLDCPHEDQTLRHAACALIQAYLTSHSRIAAHFLQRAISGHARQDDEAANTLTTLIRPDGGDVTGVVFASWIVQDLIFEDVESKNALRNVREGDESEGEDVLSFIQALGSQLQAALHESSPTDERVVAAYATLLVTFLWEFAEGVDDLLAEGSSLLQALTALPRTMDALTVGLAAALMGAIYEFSTKDSPIPRRTLSPLLTHKLGRSKYLDALVDLRRQPAVRDFDLLTDEEDGDSAILSRAFIDLFTVEYSRLRKAIDKDPGMEVLPASAAEAGVDRDILDDLRQQLQTTRDALTQAQEQALAAAQKAEQEQLAGAKDLQMASAEVERLRRINSSMQQGHESELKKVAREHEQSSKAAVAEHQRAMEVAKVDAQRQVQGVVRESEDAFAARVQEFERKIAEMGNSLRAEQGSHGNTRKELEGASTKHDALSSEHRALVEQHADLSQRHQRSENERSRLATSATELERTRKDLEEREAELENFTSLVADLREEVRGKDEELATERTGFADLERELDGAKKAAVSDGGVAKELEEAREGGKAAKEELESMLLVMGDLEAERDRYRAKVKELGGEVSEEENDDDGDEEDDQDEVD